MGIADKALVKQTQQVVQSYGTSDDVQALSNRIMAMHPAAGKIGSAGCYLLAQLGLALGLNPLPGTGHIHAWMEGGQLCVHIGVEGRMALARNESMFSFRARVMTAQEVEEHGLKQGDRGKVVELYRHDVSREQTAIGIGVIPFVGVGVARSNEYAPKGRTLSWRAEQRALKDAIRNAYSFRLPAELIGKMNLVESENSRVSQIIDQEDGAEPSAAVSQKTPEQKEKDKADGRALWDEPAAARAADNGPAYTPALAPEEAEEGEVRETESRQSQQPAADDLDALDLDALKETWSYIYKTSPKGDKPQGISPSSTEAQWRDHIRAYRAKQSQS